MPCGPRQGAEKRANRPADRLGTPPTACLMVGNDIQRDILPAQEVGMHTFWVDEWAAHDDPQAQPDRRGKLRDLIDWIRDNQRHTT